MEPGRTVRVGNTEMRWGDSLKTMEDLSPLLQKNDFDTLRDVLRREGYAFIKGLLPKHKIGKARSVVVACLQDDMGVIDPAHGELHIKSNAALTLTGFRTVTHHPDVMDVLEGAELVRFFSSLFETAPATFDTKWVRVKGKDQNTSEHTDFYFFADAAQDMFTCWIPLGDYTIDQGVLSVCPCSHLLDAYTEIIDEQKIDLPASFEEFNKTAVWVTTPVEQGDVVVFDIRTVHASTTNLTSDFRVSMDTRWKPAYAVGENSNFRILRNKLG